MILSALRAAPLGKHHKDTDHLRRPTAAAWLRLAQATERPHKAHPCDAPPVTASPPDGAPHNHASGGPFTPESRRNETSGPADVEVGQAVSAKGRHGAPGTPSTARMR